MGTNVLNISLGSKIKIKGEIYSIVGYSELSEDKYSDGFKEYKLVGQSNGIVRWLCFDYEDLEYSFYVECSNSEEFREENIKKIGYRKVYTGEAEVRKAIGDAEVDEGESVRYVEYEDFSEENIMTIEYWNSGLNYYKGYYIEEYEIISLDSVGNNKSYASESKSTGNKITKSKWIIPSLIVMVVLIVVGIGVFTKGFTSKSNLRKSIEKNDKFSYMTSTTSDLEQSLKADVYSTNMNIESTVKALIDMVEGNIEDVMENTEDSTVIVLTKDELALVYSSEEGDTLIQISSREYAYTSGVNPYRANERVSSYYRTYYYNRAYNTDRNRYGKRKSNYSTYKVETNMTRGTSNNQYSSYSNSIRQSSTSTRVSSGGGTSSGK